MRHHSARLQDAAALRPEIHRRRQRRASAGRDPSRHLRQHRALHRDHPVEHFAGAFPLWLAPVQVVVLPIADRHVEYAERVRQQLLAAGLRAELDARQEKINYKIREAQLQKMPYMLVIGDREAAEGAVAVRSRAKGDLGARPVDTFVADALAEVAAKTVS